MRTPLRPALPAAVILVCCTLTDCSGGVLDPQGPVGAGDAKIMLDALVIMLMIVVPTIVATLAFAWWFRASNKRARYWPDWSHSGRLELLTWSIPLLTIMFLSGLIWVGAHELDPYQPIAARTKDQRPLTVQVVSLDWKWLFIYPEQGIASVNELTVPAGTPVHFLLTSATVMNAFFVPQLGSMIATMNRMQTQLYLMADHPGDYLGESAQYSGDGFSGMTFTLHAVAPDAFAAWVDSVKRGGPVLDRAGYTALEQPSEDVRPFTYRAAEPHLFEQIVRDEIPPGPGPGRPDGGAVLPPNGPPAFNPGGNK